MLNVEVRDGSAIWLRNLIKNLLAEGTQNQVKDTLLIRVEIEDDVNVRISLCHMLAKAFIVFDVDNWGPELSDLSPNVGTRLEMLLEQLIGKPLVIVQKTSLKCLLYLSTSSPKCHITEDESKKITEAVIKSSHGTDLVRAALSVNNKKASQPNLLSTSYGANVKECFVKEWDFGIGNKELMLLTCRVLPSFDELETELTRPLPPGDV
ncbi:PHD finger protein-like protein, partial [Tanacetum coccineum]